MQKKLINLSVSPLNSIPLSHRIFRAEGPPGGTNGLIRWASQTVAKEKKMTRPSYPNDPGFTSQLFKLPPSVTLDGAEREGLINRVEILGVTIMDLILLSIL
jgi:hypothetical protein